MNQGPYPHSKAPTLLGLIGEWHALTGQQTEAIQRSDWAGTMRLGRAKEKLSELMDAAIVALGMAPRDEHSHELRLAVQDLVRLEQSNSQVLSERSRQLRGELEQLRGETQRLRLIRNAYRRTRQTPWHSYL